MPTRPLPDGRIPVLLSAHEEGLIGQDASAIVNYLARFGEHEDLTAAVAGTLLRIRRVRRYRAVVRAADRAELSAGLQALANGEKHSLVTRSSENAALRTAFVFPGQGNQWPSMGADAYRWLPAYRSQADRCAEAFTAAGLSSPLPYLVDGARRQGGPSSGPTRSRAIDGDGRHWSQIHIQGAQFTHAVSLAEVWRSCGILPDMTVGQSLGEVAAAYVAGAIELPDAVGVVAARATVVDRFAGCYSMAVLSVGVEEAEQFIVQTPGWLEIAVVSTPSSVVVSGDRDAVAAVVRLVQKRGIFAREIAVDYPGHTSALEPLRDMFEGLLPASAFVDAPVEFIGAACGTVVDPHTDFIDYWYANLRDTARFDRAVAAAVQRGAGAFIEMSAHPSLLSALTDLVGDAIIVESGRRDEPITGHLSANIAAAAVADPDYRWAGLAAAGEDRPLPGFPNAPMRAVHLWAAPEPLPDDEPHPRSAIRVAFEEWVPCSEPPPAVASATPCGVAIVGSGADQGALAGRLADAIAAHPGCHQVSPDEAEIVAAFAPAAFHTDVTVAADEAAGLPRAGLPDYAGIIGPRCRRVWLFTRGAEQVDPADPVGLPAQAALAAMHRSIAFEFPDQAFGHLDLPGGGFETGIDSDIDTDIAASAVDVLLGDTAEVALRANESGCRRWTRTLREHRAATPDGGLGAGALDSVVITGGSGTIGLAYARHCIDHGARRVILLSRKGVDPETVDRLVDGRDAEVVAPACDITEPDALSAAVAEHGGDGASLVIHAAGGARFGPHSEITGADLAEVFGAKVHGLARFVEVWPLRESCRILLCSSVSGVWGGYGHAGYAASNRMLDVLAGQLRAKGRDAVAVRWGLWQDTGIAAADEIARIERSGLVAMEPDAAVSASLRHCGNDPLILAADLDRLRMFFESQGVSTPFAAAPAGEAAADDDGSSERPVPEVVRAELAAVLSLDGAESIDLSAALTDLGVDSLLALDLRTRLRRGTGNSVPLARLLGGITGVELVEALQSNPGAEAAATPQRTA